MPYKRLFCWTTFAAAIAALGVLALCARPAVSGSPEPAAKGEGDPHVIRIISSLPRTGSARQQTDTIVNGIKMALEEANDRVGDFKIEFQDRDDATASAGEWTPELETSNAKAAAADPDCMVYIGPYNSGAAKISMPILNQAALDGVTTGLLMISPSNTTPGLTKKNPYDPREPGVYRPTGKINYVRVVPTDDLQGPLGADWAKQMGMKRIFVLDDQEVYGQGLAQMFAQRCDDIGLNVIGYDSVDAHELEFRSLMTRIKFLHPDLIYFGGTTETKGGQVAKDMVAVGLKAKLMVPDGCMEAGFIQSAGAQNLNDRCFVTFGGLPSEAFETGDKAFNEKHAAQKQFVDHYKAQFGHLPEVYAVYGYEAAKVALEAIRRAGKKDRAAIIAACLAIRNFHGALGTWSFDANGDTTMHRLSGNVVHDGTFKFVKTLGDYGLRRMMPYLLAAATVTSEWHVEFLQQCINGLTFGALIALIALGYTMVYGIIGLINFAHGDLFMLGSFFALTLVGVLHLEGASTAATVGGILLLLVLTPMFCAGLNWSADRVVYKPLRNAPKLAPLVSAIGVSFSFMNIGQWWGGSADRDFPDLIERKNLLAGLSLPLHLNQLQFTLKDLLLLAVVTPTMIALTLLVKRTQLGRAMRATSQDPIAARLMGIPVERVIGATFLIGGALAGIASVTYGLYINTIQFQMGYKTGLYAFTAAVLGGIGNIPGAVLGGVVIGLVRSLGIGYVSQHWVDALIFGILIVILVFRPTGLLGERTREKV